MFLAKTGRSLEGAGDGENDGDSDGQGEGGNDGQGDGGPAGASAGDGSRRDGAAPGQSAARARA